MMRKSFIPIAGALVAGCAASTMPPPAPPVRTADQQATFMRLVGDKIAGPPVSCLPTWNTNDMSIIDGQTIAFRQGTGLVNVVTLGPGCEALSVGGYALQTRQFGQGLCSGDIAQVVDTLNRVTMGSCVIGPIVPYQRPGG